MGIENQVDKRRRQSLEESIITTGDSEFLCVLSVLCGIAFPMFFHHSDV